jgi:hypothetical protein
MEITLIGQMKRKMKFKMRGWDIGYGILDMG